jgi:hypothetical protein
MLFQSSDIDPPIALSVPGNVVGSCATIVLNPADFFGTPGIHGDPGFDGTALVRSSIMQITCKLRLRCPNVAPMSKYTAGKSNKYPQLLVFYTKAQLVAAQLGGRWCVLRQGCTGLAAQSPQTHQRASLSH